MVGLLVGWLPARAGLRSFKKKGCPPKRNHCCFGMVSQHELHHRKLKENLKIFSGGPGREKPLKIITNQVESMENQCEPINKYKTMKNQ